MRPGRVRLEPRSLPFPLGTHPDDVVHSVDVAITHVDTDCPQAEAVLLAGAVDDDGGPQVATHGGRVSARRGVTGRRVRGQRARGQGAHEGAAAAIICRGLGRGVTHSLTGLPWGPLFPTLATLLLLQCPKHGRPIRPLHVQSSLLGTQSPQLSLCPAPPPLSWGSSPASPTQDRLPLCRLKWVRTDKGESGPWALPAVMMRDRAETEADLGTRPPPLPPLPPLEEALDFSGAGSLGPPRRRPRPASRGLGVECRAPMLLLRRRAWLRAAVSARGSAGSAGSPSNSPRGPKETLRPFLPGCYLHSPASWPLLVQFPRPAHHSQIILYAKVFKSPLPGSLPPHPFRPLVPPSWELGVPS